MSKRTMSAKLTAMKFLSRFEYSIEINKTKEVNSAKLN